MSLSTDCQTIDHLSIQSILPEDVRELCYSICLPRFRLDLHSPREPDRKFEYQIVFDILAHPHSWNLSIRFARTRKMRGTCREIHSICHPFVRQDLRMLMDPCRISGLNLLAYTPWGKYSWNLSIRFARTRKMRQIDPQTHIFADRGWRQYSLRLARKQKTARIKRVCPIIIIFPCDPHPKFFCFKQETEE